MQRFALLSILVLSAAGLAGCAGGASAIDAVGGADQSASSWASDSVLVWMEGLEINRALTDDDLEELRAEIKEMEESDDEEAEIGAAYLAYIEAIGAKADTKLMDGRTPAWVSVYISAEKSAALYVVVDASGSVLKTAESKAPPEAAPFLAMISAMGDVRKNWSVDAPQAAAAVRNENLTLVDAIAKQGNTSVEYGLDILDLEWTVQVRHELRGTVLTARVNATSGEVTSFKIRVSGLPAELRNVTVPVEPEPVYVLPDDIWANETVVAGADPFNFVLGGPCAMSASSCTMYPFEALNPVEISATLRWNLPASDFDFYVLDPAGEVVLQGANPVGTVGAFENMAGTLAAGEYQIAVVAWAVANERYELHASFALPGNVVQLDSSRLAQLPWSLA